MYTKIQIAAYRDKCIRKVAWDISQLRAARNSLNSSITALEECQHVDTAYTISVVDGRRKFVDEQISDLNQELKGLYEASDLELSTEMP